MNYRVLLVYTLILIILGCESAETIKTGTYEFSRISRVEMGFRYVFQGVRGINCSAKSLILNSDSSFVYAKAPFIITGKWEFNKDSLFLLTEECRWENDSLKMNYPPDKTPMLTVQPAVFKVKDDYLLRFLPTNDNKRIIEKLKFITP